MTDHTICPICKNVEFRLCTHLSETDLIPAINEARHVACEQYTRANKLQVEWKKAIELYVAKTIEYEAMRIEKDEWQGECLSVSATLVDAGLENDKLKDEIAELEADKNSLAETLDVALNAGVGDCDELKVELEAQIADNDDEIERLSHVDSEIDDLRLSNQRIRYELETANEHLGKAVKSRDLGQQVIECARARETLLRIETDELKTRLEKAVNALRKILDTWSQTKGDWGLEYLQLTSIARDALSELEE
jgi:DNA repair ATPase RecN